MLNSHYERFNDEWRLLSGLLISSGLMVAELMTEPATNDRACGLTEKQEISLLHASEIDHNGYET